ncbi:probable insulin-like peptide 5 [Lucilia cuprina]|uniref:probable insulin-like peptide 5 n=1 Tax=Lucilia cuprina TaxID=7375 RepID=UPI001F052276|nr:probable insulin-like peptide 5 [Lucilia cuprina]
MFSTKYIITGLLMVLVISDFTRADFRLCGQSLTQFLEMICIDGFNPKNLSKKSVPLDDYNDNSLENDALSSHPFSSLFMDKLYHGNLMAKTRRRRHDGVAEECCRKSCSMSELTTYCL